MIWVFGSGLRDVSLGAVEVRGELGCPSMLCRTSLYKKGEAGEGGAVAGPLAGSNCNCEECDGTDPHCLLRELQLFPLFNSTQAAELMTGQR